MNFDQTSVIITGGNKGIGLSIATMFSKKTNHPIVLIARNKNELEKARDLCQTSGAKKVDIISADITDEDELKNINWSQYNPGILINNAGSFLFKKLQDTSKEEFEGQFGINAFAAFNVTRFILPELDKQERALIVNIASMSALKGLGHSGAYSMSKHALLGYTRSLRIELKKTQIAVTAINLGQTYSTSWKNVDINSDELIDPDDVGKLIISLSELSARTVAEEILLMPQGGQVKPM